MEKKGRKKCSFLFFEKNDFFPSKHFCELKGKLLCQLKLKIGEVENEKNIGGGGGEGVVPSVMLLSKNCIYFEMNFRD